MLRGAGYDGVEIPIFDTEVDKYERLGRRLDELGLTALGVTARTGDTSPISGDSGSTRARARGDKVGGRCVRGPRRRTLCGPIEAPLGEFSGAGADG